ncbi:hypothetical protein ACQP1G_20605 [Nocardia sp. CA-107356]|uniref:hypothetical protein n=1 Tax=Nocardia sp. CA-107356 TaxID=3239972 RepID=UPI003D8CE969
MLADFLLCACAGSLHAAIGRSDHLREITVGCLDRDSRVDIGPLSGVDAAQAFSRASMTLLTRQPLLFASRRRRRWLLR